VSTYNLEKKKIVASAAMELILDEFKSGRLRQKHAVSTWNLGIISAFT
jgi:hypothetical protein